MAKAIASKYPKEIFVRVEEDADGNYFLADERPADFADPHGAIEAARYKLVDVVKVTTRTAVRVNKA